MDTPNAKDLRKLAHGTLYLLDEVDALRAEVERLRAALLEIADRSGETAIWDMCHKALGTVGQ